MARKQTIDAILGLFKKLGGNTSEVLGTKTNVNFLGKGKSPELMLDMDINQEALAVLPQSKAVEELTNSVGYAVSGKLNDIQANQLLKNMQKMDEVYFPPAAPANITDLATRTRNLDEEGLMSLRMSKAMDENKSILDAAEETEPLYKQQGYASVRDMHEAEAAMGNPISKNWLKNNPIDADDLPPPGSRGGPEDIAAPFSGAGLEAIKNVKGSNLIVDDIVNKIYKNAGVAENAQPVARANAREFLNRVKDLEDPTNPGGPTLSSIMEADDFKFMTEGGGGGMGDPLLLVQKYFGPRVASSVAQLDNADDIQKFAERLVRVRDAKGNTITDRNFDPESVDPNTLQGIDVFDFADGGLARLGYRSGKLVGKALGMFKRQQALERGAGEGFAAAEAYGITGPMVSKLFRDLAMDRTLVGKEKTEYFKILNEALKNPERYPDEILQIQKKLGIDIGMKGGGLAKILEV